MSDKAHKMTDEMIEELEKKISKTYNQAYKETSEKLNKYLLEFQTKDEAQKALVDAGKLSQEDYEKWRYGQILTGKRWKELNETIAEDLMRADSKSRSIIGDHMSDAYALNRNYAVYSIEKDAQIDTSYTLYNRRAVENILKDDPNLLPYPKTESPTAQKLRERIDLQWNRQHVNNAVTQGIIQGEPVDKVAKRLMDVVGMDGRAALRNARTMMTGAQNKGRQDGFDELKEKGVDIRERWIATLDDRTRHSHRLLHGEYKDPDTGKYSNGLEYPGDPFGEPEEVYNCRCTELAEVAGFPLDIPTWSPDMGDMTFEEWLGEHEEAEAINVEAVNRFGNRIVFDDSFNAEKWKDVKPLINDLSNEYETKLETVKTGAQKAAGEVQISGSVMTLSSNEKTVALHEFAHTLSLENQTKFGLYDEKDFWKEIKKVRRAYMKDVENDPRRWISTYEHSGRSVDEFMAEAFTYAKAKELGIELPSKYGEESKYANMVLEIVDKYYKKNRK